MTSKFHDERSGAQCNGRSCEKQIPPLAKAVVVMTIFHCETASVKTIFHCETASVATIFQRGTASVITIFQLGTRIWAR